MRRLPPPPRHRATGTLEDGTLEDGTRVHFAESLAMLAQEPWGDVGFSVIGMPGPQGSKRHVGNGVMVESSAKVKPWRQDVRDAALLARNGAAPLDGPLVMRIVFTLPKPASAPKRKRTYPCKKPDLDKLLRSTLDALKTAGLIADDARVVEFDRLAKVYPGEDPDALDVPGARIEVRRMETRP